MAEELQAGRICGGNYWMTPSRNLFSSSPCSLATNDFGWSNPIMEIKAAKSTIDSSSDAWINQEFLHDNGESEQNILQQGVCLDSSRNYRTQHNLDLNQSNLFNQSFPLEQPPPPFSNSISNFPLNSDTYSYTTSLIQTLFDSDSNDNQTVNYSSSVSNDHNPFLPKLDSSAINHVPFTSNAPVWNSHYDLPTFCTKENEKKVTKKANNEPAFKRQRIETPSPLPTFKVRKEKLGDRITALQQLVSPFGKTDTASVLHEAIEYIKFLHDQVSVYSAPYLKNSATSLHRQQASHHRNEEGEKHDLKGRGLCLVPISSTFPVAAETTADFWTPTFGGTFK